MIYKWRETKRFKSIDPNVAGEELKRIAKANGGALTPPTLLSRAKNKDNPLHECFDWNDTLAAGKWRTEQARSIIRSIEVVYDDRGGEPKVTRAYVNLRGPDQHYESTYSVMTNSEKRDRFLDQARSDMNKFIRRYQDFEELSDVIGEMKKFLPTW